MLVIYLPSPLLVKEGIFAGEPEMIAEIIAK